MSVAAMTCVWASSPVGGGPMMVLLAIADCANDEGWAWPSQVTLAAKTRMSERQVRRIVKELEGMGELEIHVRQEGRKRKNAYRVLTGQIVRQSLEVTTGQNTPPRPDTAMSSESSTEPSVGRKTSSSSPEEESKRDLVWDALTAVFFVPHTKQEKTRIGQAARELRAAVKSEYGDMNGSLDDKCAAEVVRRMAAYPPEWSERTPEALVKHWTRLGVGNQTERTRHDDLRRRIAETEKGATDEQE